MEKSNIITINEIQRPFWHLVIASLLFTLAVFLIISFIYKFNLSKGYLKSFHGTTVVTTILIVVGLNFCTEKCIYIDIKNSRFKPSLEIGPIKIGSWKTIKNYEYVAIFYNPSKRESEQFEVNLWYNGNNHFELYSRNNFEDAISVAYDLSEQLNIDLLDALRNFKKN